MADAGVGQGLGQHGVAGPGERGERHDDRLVRAAGDDRPVRRRLDPDPGRWRRRWAEKGVWLSYAILVLAYLALYVTAARAWGAGPEPGLPTWGALRAAVVTSAGVVPAAFASGPWQWAQSVVVNEQHQKLSKQTRAQAVAADDGVTKVKVLQLLGLAPPPELIGERPQVLWSWAIEHWRIDSLRGQRELAMN